MIVVLLSLIMLTIPTIGWAAPDQQDGLQIFARDVFVIEGPSLRNPDDTTEASASLFNVAGVPLNLTWGQWSTASAASTTRIVGTATHVQTDEQIHLTGLIPHGIYSIFYVTITPDSHNSRCPSAERGIALPSATSNRKNAPDSSSFTADSHGRATFEGLAEGNLLSGTQLIYQIVYHSDGQTYGAVPNHGEANTQGANCHSSFGEDAMRQLQVLQKIT